jgi:hypothetical protein
MTTTATRLAAAIEEGWACDTSPDEMTAAAAELRRLDAEVVALKAFISRTLSAYETAAKETDRAADALALAMKGAANG